MTKRRAWSIAGLVLLTTFVGVSAYFWYSFLQDDPALAGLQQRVEPWSGHVFAEEPRVGTFEPIRRRLGHNLSLRVFGSPGIRVGSKNVDATKEQLGELLAASPIHRVNLAGCSNLDDDWIAGLHETSSMIQLGLGGTGVTDRSLPRIEEMRGLAYLDLANTAISDKAVQRLQDLPELHEFSVGGPNIKAIQLVDLAVVDDAGRPAVAADPTLHIRGSIKFEGIPGSACPVLVLVRSSSQWPPWRSRPYGRTAHLSKQSKLTEASPGVWTFRVDISGIASGPSSVEVWVDRQVPPGKVVLYRMKPSSIDLAPVPNDISKVAEPARDR